MLVEDGILLEGYSGCSGGALGWQHECRCSFLPRGGWEGRRRLLAADTPSPPMFLRLLVTVIL